MEGEVKPGKAQSILNAEFKFTLRSYRDKMKKHIAQTHNAAFTLSVNILMFWG